MCGRYAKELGDLLLDYHRHLRDFVDALDAAAATSLYNVAPGTMQLVRCADGVVPAKWGLLPYWSKDGKGRQINARSETVSEKPMFKDAFRTRRCLTWATGYFEWKTLAGGKKQPYFIHFADHRPFFFYGIWGAKDGEASFATLTTVPREELVWIHDRMPCIVEVDSPDVDRWLDHTDSDSESRRSLLAPFSGKLVATQVTSYVNNVRNQGPECVQPAE